MKECVPSSFSLASVTQRHFGGAGPRSLAERVSKSTAWRSGSVSVFVFTVMFAFALSGCLTPLAVVPAGFAELRLIDFPPGTELVELSVGDSAVLRGVFVPGGPAAPVVVHFPAMFESISWGAASDAEVKLDEDGWLVASAQVGIFGVSQRVARVHLKDGQSFDFENLSLTHGLYLELRRAGCAVLAIDYGGVGASTGSCSAANLARDARAIYAEALRRADNDPNRVVLRGVSLGGLAVAQLLADGVQPAAVSLSAPVRGESVVRHFARRVYGSFVAWFADLLYDHVGSADLQAEVARNEAPLFLALPEHDSLMSDDERHALRAAAEAHGAQILLQGALHEELALAARCMLPGELEFLDRSVPGMQAARLRRRDQVLQRLQNDPLVVSKLESLTPAQRALLEQLAEREHWSDPRLPLIFALQERGAARAAALQVWCEWQSGERLAALPWNALQALVRAEYPVYYLEPAWLTAMASSGPAIQSALLDESDLVRLVLHMSQDFSGSLSSSAGVGGLRRSDAAEQARLGLMQYVDREGIGEQLASVSRELLQKRLRLRLAAVPDRLRRLEDGAELHELWWQGAWHEVSSFLP